MRVKTFRRHDKALQYELDTMKSIFYEHDIEVIDAEDRLYMNQGKMHFTCYVLQKRFPKRRKLQ